MPNFKRGVKQMEKKVTDWISKQKPTIYDIKRCSYADSPYFFTRDTMRFFKQTLKDFRVYKEGFNKWHIVALSKFEHGTHKTERYFSFTGFNIGKLSNVS